MSPKEFKLICFSAKYKGFTFFGGGQTGIFAPHLNQKVI